MANVFHCVGVIVVALLSLYVIGGIIYCIAKKVSKESSSDLPLSGMPLLRPLPIRTKNRFFFMRILVWIYDVREWELAANWEYELSSGDRIILPKGFRFDGASIPRPLWALLNPSGLLLIPGLIHDYGYRYQQLWKVDRAASTVSPYKEEQKKTYWDRLFLDVGKQVNGTRIINLAAFLAVYLFGYGAWRNNRKKNKTAFPPFFPHFPIWHSKVRPTRRSSARYF